MSDPIANRVVDQVAQRTLEQGSSAGAGQPGEVDKADQNRFDEAMKQPSTAAAESAQDINQLSAADQVGRSDKTMGDAILEGIEKLKTSHESRLDKIQQQIVEIPGQEMSIQDAMKLQFEVMQMSIEQDLTTKVADKTSQGVQTLFKNQ